MAGRWERLSPLAGALAVPFWIAGVAVMSSSAKGDKGAEAVASYHHHGNGILLGGLLWSLGVLLFIWFLGSLRSHYLAAERSDGRLSHLAWGSGLIASALALLIPGPDEVGALNKNDFDASGAAVLRHLSDAFFIATEYALPVLFFASAILALRYAALPRWLGWVSILVGIVLLIGPIGWAGLIFATPIWTLIVSVVVWRRGEAVASPARRSTEPVATTS
jgi:hypothetical protein